MYNFWEHYPYFESRGFVKLDEWYENKFSLYGEDVTHFMYHVFDEYVLDDLGDGKYVGTTSIKFKYKDGTESEWYHPPKDTVDHTSKDGYLFFS